MEYDVRQLDLIWGGTLWRIVCRPNPLADWYALGGANDYWTVEEARAALWEMLAAKLRFEDRTIGRYSNIR